MFQVYSKLTQLYTCVCVCVCVCILLRFFSHIGYYRILSRVPCAMQYVFVDYLLYI